MNDKINQIETKLGRTVHVGKIAGLGTDTIWACVDNPRISARIQCPATTAEDAVNSLFDEVMK